MVCEPALDGAAVFSERWRPRAVYFSCNPRWRTADRTLIRTHDAETGGRASVVDTRTTTPACPPVSCGAERRSRPVELAPDRTSARPDRSFGHHDGFACGLEHRAQRAISRRQWNILDDGQHQTA